MKKYFDLDSLKEFIKTNKPILKTQQRFRSEKHHVFTEETALRSIEKYAYEINKNLVCKKKESKCNNIIQHYTNF